MTRSKDNNPDKYNEKLFKQAYKAAQKAREIDKKNEKKKRLLKITYFLLIPIVLGITVLIYFKTKKEPLEYIEVGNIPVIQTMYEWEEPELSRISQVSGLDVKTKSKSYIAVNEDSGEILSGYNTQEKLPIASLTKLMSTLVALDYYKLDDTITVHRENLPQDLSWELELEEGDTILVEDIFEAMLISSYNDAAYSLANAYGYTQFIQQMNNKAKALGMINTNFSNPAGWDSPNNYSTVQDLSKLMTAVLNNKTILEITSKPASIVTWRSDGEAISKTIYTTNQLLNVNPYNRGLKTGITDQAGQCFIGYFQYDNQNTYTIVLGSTDRFTDTNLIERNFRK